VGSTAATSVAATTIAAVAAALANAGVTATGTSAASVSHITAARQPQFVTTAVVVAGAGALHAVFF
jgi:hypothetical protein